jgi:hypothetical protein
MNGAAEKVTEMELHGTNTSGHAVVVRETLDGQSRLVRATDGSTILTNQNAEYTILDEKSLSELQVARSWREGNDLRVQLIDGTFLVFLNHFCKEDEAPGIETLNQPTDWSSPALYEKSAVENQQPQTETQNLESSNSTYQADSRIPENFTSSILTIGGAVGGLLSLANGRSGKIINNNNSGNTTGDPTDDTSNSSGDSALSDEIIQLKDQFETLKDQIDESLDDVFSQLESLAEPNNSNDTLQVLLLEALEVLKNAVTAFSSSQPNSVTINNYNGSNGTNQGSDTPSQTDTTPPTIIRTFSTSGREYFTQNERIDFTLETSEIVSGTGDVSAIEILMSDGGKASYTGGVGTKLLHFSYLVTEVDNLTPLDTVSLQLNGARLHDAAGNSLNLTIGPQNALSKSNTIYIEPFPVIESIGFHAKEEFLNNETPVESKEITVEVNFSHPVTINGDGSLLRLTLNTGGTATYLSGSGTQTLVFKYQPETGDYTELLRVIGVIDDTVQIKGVHGAIAQTQISDDQETTYSVDGSLVSNIQIDFDVPTIETVKLEALTIGENESDTKIIVDPETGEETEVWTKVSGTLSIEFTDEVYLQSSAQKPYLSLRNVLALPPDLSHGDLTAKAELIVPMNGTISKSSTLLFQFEGWVSEDPPTNEIEVDYLVRNNATIIDASGNNAQLALDASVISTQFEIDQSAVRIIAAAGRFDPNSIDVEILDERNHVNRDLQNDSSAIFLSGNIIVSAKDNNGELSNYQDEFSGKLTSLGQPGDSRSTLRAMISHDSITKSAIVSPLTELAIAAYERAVSVNVDTSTINFNEKVSKFFEISSIVNAPISFIYDEDFARHTPTTDEFNYGIALALLSMMDHVSGSVFKTVDLLSPIFSGENMTPVQIAGIDSLIDECITLLGSTENTLYQAYKSDIENVILRIQDATVTDLPNFSLPEEEVFQLLDSAYTCQEDFDLEVCIVNENSIVTLDNDCETSDFRSVDSHVPLFIDYSGSRSLEFNQLDEFQ